MASPLLAFTTDHVTRLTGLSGRVLRYWEETGVFTASYTVDDPRRPYRRLYSFRDVVGLRVLAALRREHRVELDELRRVGKFLRQYQDAPWASMKMRIAGRHVVFDDPETGVAVSGKPFRHAVVEFDFAEVARNTENEAAKLRERVPEDIGEITRHRYVNHNAWVISGTRIPTSAIWNFHEAGYSAEQIIAEYPQLYPEDVESAIAHERTLRSAA